MVKIVSSILSVSLINTVGKFLGFLRDILIAFKFGASTITDIFLLAFTIPQMVFSTQNRVISTTVMPIVADLEKNELHEKKFIHSFFSLMFFCHLFIYFIVFITSEGIVVLLAPTYSGQEKDLLIKLIRIMFVSVVFMGIFYFMKAILEFRKKYKSASYASLFINGIVVIWLILIGDKLGVYGLAVAVIIGPIVTATLVTISMVMAGYFRKRDFREYLLINSNSRIRETFPLLWPILCVSFGFELNRFVERMLASTLETGSVTLLSIGSRIPAISTEVIVAAVLTLVYPRMTKYSANKETDKLMELTENTLASLIFFLVPITFGLLILSKPLISLLFGYSSFSEVNIRTLGLILSLTAPSLVFEGLKHIVYRVFYSLKMPKAVMYNGLSTVVINIILNIALIMKYGIYGIAVSISISSFVTCMMLLFSLKRKYIEFRLKQVILEIGRSLLSSIPVVILLYSLINSDFFINHSIWIQGLSLSIVILVNLAIYILCMKLLSSSVMTRIFIKNKSD